MREGGGEGERVREGCLSTSKLTVASSLDQAKIFSSQIFDFLQGKVNIYISPVWSVRRSFFQFARN